MIPSWYLTNVSKGFDLCWNYFWWHGLCFMVHSASMTQNHIIFLLNLFIHILIMPSMAITKSKIASQVFQHFNIYSSAATSFSFLIYNENASLNSPSGRTKKHLLSTKRMWTIVLVSWWEDIRNVLRVVEGTEPQL